MTDYARKSLDGLEWKAESAGAFRATIATFNVIDRDGDVTFPGAFPVGKELIVGAYNHTSMPPIGAMPTGKAVIGADNQRAWIDGKFFLDTPEGLSMYRTVKNLGTAAEWSYAFPPPKTAAKHSDQMRPYPGALRGLVGLDPVEASAVVKGAGIGTGTDFIKSDGPTDDDVVLERWLGALHELKVGRALSAASRTRLQGVLDELQKFLAETQPKSDDEKTSDESLNRLMRDLERMRSEQLIPVRFL